MVSDKNGTEFTVVEYKGVTKGDYGSRITIDLIVCFYIHILVSKIVGRPTQTVLLKCSELAKKQRAI